MKHIDEDENLRGFDGEGMSAGKTPRRPNLPMRVADEDQATNTKPDPIPTWQEIQSALGCGASAAQKKRNGARKVTPAEAVQLADELERDLGALVRALATKRAEWVKKQKERDNG